MTRDSQDHKHRDWVGGRDRDKGVEVTEVSPDASCNNVKDVHKSK